MKLKYLQICSITLLFINATMANLYGYDKHVVELTQAKFRDFVFNKDYASLVEFYNSFCGACRRYSQTWKTFALDISAWGDVVKVAGVDCSENDELCREYDIQYFPSIRYFSPYLKDDPEEKQLGIQSTAREIAMMKLLTVNYLQNETSIPHHWPDLTPLENITEPNDIFENVSDDVKYAILVFPGPTNLELGYELSLDYHKEKEIIIKQINSTEVANILGIETVSTIHSMGRDLKLEKLPTEVFHNYKTIKKVLEKYLIDHGIIVQQPKDIFVNKTVPRDNRTLSDEELHVLNNVRNMTHIVFQADLERALKFSLTTEIYKNQELQGESLEALRNYVAVVKKYSPLGARGEKFFEDLSNFINESSDSIDVTLYKRRIQELEKDTEFFDNRWVGCQGSAPNLRGFSCGLWTLFHYFTVCAANSNDSNDTLEVLSTIHDYVKHFFGCTECANHFQEMARDKGMWNVTTKDEALLWLWRAHNTVSDRISGDVTDDPVFPKIKFPSYTACSQCRPGFNFSENEVLIFLKKIHSDENISRYGTASIEDSVTAKYIRIKNENESNIVSGNLPSIIVIGFCICILIIIAFLFIPRRKRNFRGGNYSEKSRHTVQKITIQSHEKVKVITLASIQSHEVMSHGF